MGGLEGFGRSLFADPPSPIRAMSEWEVWCPPGMDRGLAELLADIFGWPAGWPDVRTVH